MVVIQMIPNLDMSVQQKLVNTQGTNKHNTVGTYFALFRTTTSVATNGKPITVNNN